MGATPRRGIACHAEPREWAQMMCLGGDQMQVGHLQPRLAARGEQREHAPVRVRAGAQKALHARETACFIR